jgi:hypothetical protein
MNEGLETLSAFQIDFSCSHPSVSYLATNNGLYKRDVTTDVDIEESLPSTPRTFIPFQNYPNPFNSSTTIEYQISGMSEVEIVIHTILGQKIRELTNQKQKAGYYQVRWDGKNDHGIEVASGIYICQLRTNLTLQTRKMILIR